MIVLYKKNETDFTHNGLMILQPIEAVVTEEISRLRIDLVSKSERKTFVILSKII